MKPTIGRIVLFTAAANTHQGLDGVHPAIVRKVYSDTTVSLSVLSDNHLFPVHVINSVLYDEAGATGTWAWPVIVKEAVTLSGSAPVTPTLEEIKKAVEPPKE
jgi:hypothetical protein